MSRLPGTAFAALVAATVAAFFIVQHVKVALPLINGEPMPLPTAFNPVSGNPGLDEPSVCLHPRPPRGRLAEVDYRHVIITFFLQARPARVTVQIVDAAGRVVRTLVSGYYMPTYRRNPRDAFAWDGRTRSGRLAPDGLYYYRVLLLGHAIRIAPPFRVITKPPRPAITSVTPSAVASGGAVRIGYRNAPYDRGEIKLEQLLIYRLARGHPRLLDTVAVDSARSSATWNGLIGGLPAPPGHYLLALRAIDSACDIGTYPAKLPPAPGSTKMVRVLG
jgi:hypothetical protein